MALHSIPVSEIFITSGFPEFTFVPPVVYPRLINALAQRAGGVVVEGPSGIGKTVAVTRAVEELGDTLGAVETLSARDPRHREAIKHVALEKPDGTWVIEDFHHLSKKDRVAYADAIKFLADQREPDCKIVLVGINNAGQGLLQGASDLLTRISIVQFERNPDENVEELIRLGEQWLNIRMPDHPQILAEARGSYLLAQLVCRATCEAAGLTSENVQAEPLELDVDLDVEGTRRDRGRR